MYVDPDGVTTLVRSRLSLYGHHVEDDGFLEWVERAAAHFQTIEPPPPKISQAKKWDLIEAAMIKIEARRKLGYAPSR